MAAYVAALFGVGLLRPQEAGGAQLRQLVDRQWLGFWGLGHLPRQLPALTTTPHTGPAVCQ